MPDRSLKPSVPMDASETTIGVPVLWVMLAVMVGVALGLLHRYLPIEKMASKAGSSLRIRLVAWLAALVLASFLIITFFYIWTEFASGITE